MSKGLSDLAIRKMTSEGKDRREVWDARLPGFGIRISSTGTKTFILMCRVDGRARRMTLGRYPVVSLAQARDHALTALQKIDAGVDPEVEDFKPLDEAEMNVSTVTALFLEMHCRQHNKLSTTVDVERRLRRHLIERWGTRDITSIKRSELVALFDGLVRSGRPSEANHALAHIRKLFSWCVQRGYVINNPCGTIAQPAKNNSRERALTEDELRAVWKALQTEGYPYGPYIKLLILTAQRRGEVAGMEWSQLNFDTGEWTLPPELTKNGRRHILPLSTHAQAVILSIPRIHPRFVFPSRTNPDKHMTAFTKIKERLDVASGVDDWVLHDLRRTTATFLAKLDTQPHVIERILNHVSGSFAGVAGIYNRHPYLDEMRGALERWGAAQA
jgi:integrase